MVGHEIAPAGRQAAEVGVLLDAARLRLGQLAQVAGSETASIVHIFGQAAGRLSILTASLSTETASGALGARAAAAQEVLAQQISLVSATRRVFHVGQARLAEDLAALQRPGAGIDLADPYRSRLDRLFAALCATEERGVMLAATLQDPLRRVASALDLLGVRIVLGVTGIYGPAAARIALFGRRLKELSRLFGSLIGSIDLYLQGILSGLGGLRRDLVQAGARLPSNTVPAAASAPDLPPATPDTPAPEGPTHPVRERGSFWATLLASAAGTEIQGREGD